MINKFISAIDESIKIAEECYGTDIMPKELYSTSGMASEKVKTFLNSLVYLLGAISYLEIGLLRGSTFIAALYGNEKSIVKAVGIDNWCLTDFEEFKIRFDMLLQPSENIKYINSDCFKFAPENLGGKFNVYFYDGDHSFECQKKAFTYFDSILDDEMIVIVDDWNWEPVKTGTFEAFKELNYEVVKQWELFADGNWDLVNWWNGFYIAVIKKKI